MCRSFVPYRGVIVRQRLRFLAAGTLAFVLAGGTTLATAPAALADDDCTGLVQCAGKDVGDTVGDVTKGDVDGTVKDVGKTAGDATREAGKTVRRSAGPAADQATDEPAAEPSTGQTAGTHEHTTSTGAPAHHQAAASHQQRPGHRSHAKHQRRGDHGTGAGEPSGSGISSLALRQWHEHSLPLGPGWPSLTGTARSGARSLPNAAFPSSAAMPQRDRAPAPRVAADRQAADANGAAPYLAADRRAATAPLGGGDAPSDPLVLLAAALAAATGAAYLVACRWRRPRRDG